jgi:hypothetical protein
VDVVGFIKRVHDVKMMDYHVGNHVAIKLVEKIFRAD